MPKRSDYQCSFCGYEGVVPSMVTYHECVVHDLCEEADE